GPPGADRDPYWRAGRGRGDRDDQVHLYDHRRRDEHRESDGVAWRTRRHPGERIHLGATSSPLCSRRTRRDRRERQGHHAHLSALGTHGPLVSFPAPKPILAPRRAKTREVTTTWPRPTYQRLRVRFGVISRKSGAEHSS